MPYTLVITAPDGTVTRNNPVSIGARIAMAMAEILSPYTLSRREADRLALLASRHMGDGTTWIHDPSGYRFRIETAPAIEPIRALCAADDPVAGCTPYTTCPDHTDAAALPVVR